MAGFEVYLNGRFWVSPEVVDGRKRWVYAGISLKRVSQGDGNSNHSIPITVSSREILGEGSGEITGRIE